MIKKYSKIIMSWMLIIIMTFGSTVSVFAEDLNTKYTVSVFASPSQGGYVSGSGTYYVDESVSLRAYNNSGYIFEGWFVDGQRVSTDSYYTIRVTDHKSYEARFKKETVKIDAWASPTEGGMVTVSGDMTKGSLVFLVPLANPGYKFDGWYSGNTRISSNVDSETGVLQVTALSNVAYTAKFVKDQPVVTVTINNQGSGRVTGIDLTGLGGSYKKVVDYGQSLVMNAVENNGYKFMGWYEVENGQEKLIEEDKELLLYNITKTENIIAKFQLVSVGYVQLDSVEQNEGKPEVDLIWSAASGAKYYEIYRSIDKTGEYEKLDETTTCAYNDTDLELGEQYYYKVIAYNYGENNARVESPSSNVVSVYMKQKTPTLKTKFAKGKTKVTWSNYSYPAYLELWYKNSSTKSKYKKLSLGKERMTSTSSVNVAFGRKTSLKMRTYVKVEGEKVYSSWSNVKTVY